MAELHPVAVYQFHQCLKCKNVSIGNHSQPKKYTPLQRGWTSANPCGQKLGPPESRNPDGNFFHSFLTVSESRGPK